MTSTPVGMRPGARASATKVRGATLGDKTTRAHLHLMGICVGPFVREVAGGASATGSGFGGAGCSRRAR